MAWCRTSVIPVLPRSCAKTQLYDSVRGACVYDPCVFECFIYNLVGQ